MKNTIIIVAIISTGIMSGMFFTWTNAVKPGLGTLNNISYLTAFKAMNKAILNPLFYITFILPVLTIPISACMNYSSPNFYVFKLLLACTLIYLFGVFMVTINGNIPINELLENTDLQKITETELSSLRDNIENKWNNLNLIRTISSFISFLLMIICLIKNYE